MIVLEAFLPIHSSFLVNSWTHNWIIQTVHSIIFFTRIFFHSRPLTYLPLAHPSCSFILTSSSIICIMNILLTVFTTSSRHAEHLVAVNPTSVLLKPRFELVECILSRQVVVCICIHPWYMNSPIYFPLSPVSSALLAPSYAVLSYLFSVSDSSNALLYQPLSFIVTSTRWPRQWQTHDIGNYLSDLPNS